MYNMRMRMLSWGCDPGTPALPVHPERPNQGNWGVPAHPAALRPAGPAGTRGPDPRGTEALHQLRPLPHPGHPGSEPAGFHPGGDTQDHAPQEGDLSPRRHLPGRLAAGGDPPCRGGARGHVGQNGGGAGQHRAPGTHDPPFSPLPDQALCPEGGAGWTSAWTGKRRRYGSG